MSLVSEDRGIAGEKVIYEGNPSGMEVFCSASFLMLCFVLVLSIVTGGIFFFVALFIPYFWAKSIRYRITNQRVTVTKGIFSRDEHDLELMRVKDISLHKQNLRQQMINLGTIRIVSTDHSAPKMDLNLKEPQEWRDRLRELVQQAKKEAGVQYREDI